MVHKFFQSLSWRGCMFASIASSTGTADDGAMARWRATMLSGHRKRAKRRRRVRGAGAGGEDEPQDREHESFAYEEAQGQSHWTAAIADRQEEQSAGQSGKRSGPVGGGEGYSWTRVQVVPPSVVRNTSP
jgi:hypothetical protein